MPPFVRCCQSLTEVDTPLTLKTLMKAPVYFSIGEIVENVRLKTISPKEVVDAHVQRAQALQSSLNAFVHLDVRGAREQARAAEDAVMRGRALGALHGVPLSVKGCIDVAGGQCPAGCVLRQAFV